MAKAIKRKQSSRQYLEGFLSSHDAMSMSETTGFIAALQAAPLLTAPSEWMPEVFNGEQPIFDNDKQAKKVYQALVFDLWNEIGKALTQERFTFAPGPHEPEEQKKWCAGYLQGVRFGNWNLDENHRAWTILHVYSVISGEAKASESFDPAAEAGSIFHANSEEEWLYKQERRLAAYAVLLYKLVRGLDLPPKNLS